MDTFNQQVCGNHRLLSEMVNHRRIIAHTEDGRGIMQFYIPGQVVDKPEFAVSRNFRPFHGTKLQFV
jgi:hypothetical protein